MTNKTPLLQKERGFFIISCQNSQSLVNFEDVLQRFQNIYHGNNPLIPKLFGEVTERAILYLKFKEKEKLTEFNNAGECTGDT